MRKNFAIISVVCLLLFSGCTKKTIVLERFNTIEQKDLDANGFSEMKDFKSFARSLTKEQRENIKFIFLHDNKFLKSVNGLSYFPNLDQLVILGSLIETLDGIEKAPSISNIICSDIPTLHDVSALEKLPHLLKLSLFGCGISELPNLKNTVLGDLDIGKTRIFDISNLQIPDNLGDIGYAFMNVNSLYDIQELFNYTRGLALYGNNIAEIPDDIDFKKVERVYLGNNPIAKEYAAHDIRFTEKNGVTFMFGSPSR